jgi:hypothetical protein
LVISGLGVWLALSVILKAFLAIGLAGIFHVCALKYASVISSHILVSYSGMSILKFSTLYQVFA